MSAGRLLRALAGPGLVLVVVLLPAGAADLGVRVERISDGTSVDTLTFPVSPSADGRLISPERLAVTLDAGGAAWRLVLHSSNADGRPGLRPLATAGHGPGSADSSAGIPLAWQVHAASDSHPSPGSAARDSWAPLRDRGERAWPDAVRNGEAVMAAGFAGRSSLAPWPVPGRAASSSFHVHLAADAARVSAGEYEALLTVDLLILGAPPSGPRLHVHAGRVAETVPWLSWSPSGEEDIEPAGYLLQVDTSGRFAAGELLESRTLRPDARSVRPDPLPEGPCFWRVLAVDAEGRLLPPDPPTDSFLFLPVSSPPPGQAPLALPTAPGGYRIRGNAVSLVSGYRSDLRQVRFEFRAAPGGAWESCAALGGTSNPDTRGPHWGMLWNIAPLAPGYYDVRALAGPLAGPMETSASTIRVYRTEERYALSGELDENEGVYRESVFVPGDTAGALRLFDGSEFRMTRGAGSGDSTWITAVRRARWPASAPVLPGWQPAACLRTFEMGAQPASGPNPGTGLGAPGADETPRPASGASFALRGQDPAATVEVVVPWDPAFPAASISALALFALDPLSGTWMRVDGAVADSEARVFRARVAGAGTFAVFAASLPSTASSVVVFPNPFVPNDGRAANGVPWTAGDPSSGITFGNLPGRSAIEIYTLTGERVVELDAGASAGTLRWDVRNRDGRELASGVYLALIRGDGGEPAARKIMIVR